MSDHDQLFKLLLHSFFPEFLQAFVPELYAEIDLKSIEFVDKELIRTQGGRRKAKLVDLVVRVKFHGQEGFVLIHLEHQARRDRQLGLRLFLYAAWLIEHYGLPVYPILLTSYDTPRDAEPDRFEMAVRGCGILDFRYRVVQLNRMNWRDFLRQHNPAATALMVRMRIPPVDRPKVKAQIMRLVSTMRLTPAKMGLIVAFVERYLALTAKEMVAFEREMGDILDVEERRNVMELMTSWERKGRQEGRQEGRAEGELSVIRRQLKRRFGGLDPAVEKKLERLRLQRLEALAEALLDFTCPQDLDRWLANGMK